MQESNILQNTSYCNREKAAGYCYVNDVVLGVLELRRKFKRVMVVDIGCNQS